MVCDKTGKSILGALQTGLSPWTDRSLYLQSQDTRLSEAGVSSSPKSRESDTVFPYQSSVSVKSVPKRVSKVVTILAN